MNQRPDTDARIRERELGLLRQRSITRRVLAVAFGGLAAFAGLAGVSKATQSTPTSATIKAKASAATTQQQAPVSDTPTIVAPVTPVTPTYTPPVTSSGGS
jgi:hypothetical protein